MPRKVTINDVAREADTSVGTVYRAVYNSGRVSETTRLRVLETVERLGYKANTVARGLALRNKFNILVIMPKEPSSFWGDVLKGAERAAERLSEFGVRVIMFCHEGSVDSGKTIMDVIAGEKVDAIAMTSVMFADGDQVLAYASEKEIPVAIFNDEMAGGGRLFYYGPNNYRAGALAAELIRKFCGPGGVCLTIRRAEFGSEYAANRLRLQGFGEYLSNYCPDIVLAGAYRLTRDETPGELARILRDHPGVTGIYFTDFMQLYENYTIFSELKRDIAIVGHEYSEVFRDALRDNTITALLVQEKVCQGYYPVMMLYNYLVTGEKPPNDLYYSNINVILDTNADSLKLGGNGCGYE